MQTDQSSKAECWLIRIENGELLSPQNTEDPPFNKPTTVFKNNDEIESYIKGIQLRFRKI